MKAELKAATEALKAALHSAIDDPKFNRNHLSELWRHYNGVQTIYEDCADDVPQIQFQQDILDSMGSISLDSDPLVDPVFAAGPVNLPGGEGQDVITFS